ncbi:hypothetical protein F5Y16DRAFT_397535 [Xylariaceae sp. FL0255]|nr:hypothetical protein F5Y16DRAFT_397535 [Xylariaceae sp. FL0255]
MPSIFYLGILEKVDDGVCQLCVAYQFPRTALCTEVRNMYRQRYRAQVFWAITKTDIGTTASFERDGFHTHCTVDKNGIVCALVCDGTQEEPYPHNVAKAITRSMLDDYGAKHLRLDGTRQPRSQAENRVIHPMIEALLVGYQDPVSAASQLGIPYGLRELSEAEIMMIDSAQKRAESNLRFSDEDVVRSEHGSDTEDGDEILSGEQLFSSPHSRTGDNDNGGVNMDDTSSDGTTKHGSWVVVKEDHSVDEEGWSSPRRQESVSQDDGTQSQNLGSSLLGQVREWGKLAWDAGRSQMDAWGPGRPRR